MNLFRNKNFLLLVFLSLNLLMMNSCRTEEAKDSDKDGVIDSEDKCPNLKGYVQYNGCPANISEEDMDGDGIDNMRDKCPDVAGEEEFDGCPDPETCDDRGDDDGDGILNCFDPCPDEAGENGRACPPDNDPTPDPIDPDEDDVDPIDPDEDDVDPVDPDEDDIAPKPKDDCSALALNIKMPTTTIPSLSSFSPKAKGSNWDKTEWNFGSGYSSSSSKSFTKLGPVTIKAKGTKGDCVLEASESAVVVLSKAHLKREIDKLKNYVTLSTAAVGDNKQDAIDRREDKKDEIMELLFRGDGNIIVDVKKGKNSRRSVNGFPRDFEFFYKQLLMTPDIYSGVVDLEVLETTTGQAKKIILYK